MNGIPIYIDQNVPANEVILSVCGENGSIPRAHAHHLRGTTTTDSGHRHTITIFTFPVNANSFDRHVHTYRGLTSFHGRHRHRFYGITGPAIPLPDGTHVHLASGQVYLNYGEPYFVEIEGVEYIGGVQYSPVPKEVHRHNYTGYTGKPLGFEPDHW